jgi:aspartate/methionine/tyrosine aminotransferase
MNDLFTRANLSRVIQSPFARLRDLLAGIEPGSSPIDMTVGEPRHGVPTLLGPALQNQTERYGKYPLAQGSAELLEAIAAWLGRRYPALKGALIPQQHVLQLGGSREGLFSAIFPALARKSMENPAVLMPNPFYQAYLAAAVAADVEPIFLSAEAENNFMPDLDALPASLLDRTAVFYLASPSNPQGAVASKEYLARATTLARTHNFMLFLDECYSEIYWTAAPPGGLEITYGMNGDFSNVVVFNSLSKRSSVPGLRSGFIAGDKQFLDEYLRFRNVACPQMPLPVQHASALLWGDEEHVEESRALYKQKFDMAHALLGKLEGYADPAGAFFLWLKMMHLGGSEAAAKTFWKGCGVKVLPGAYLAQVDAQGRNPGEAYVRIALVDDLSRTQDALERLARLLS